LRSIVYVHYPGSTPRYGPQKSNF